MLFGEVAGVWREIEETGSRLTMAEIFSKLLGRAQEDEIAALVYLSQGILAPEHDGIELGLGEKLTMQAISIVSGREISELEREFKKKGDLGIVAQWACQKKRQMSLSREDLELKGVYNSLTHLANMAGKGSQEAKIKAMAELLNSANADEARYIARFCVGKMRLGIAGPTILDSIAKIRLPQIKKEIVGLAEDGSVFKLEVKKILSDDEAASLEMEVEAKEDIAKLLGKRVSLVHNSKKRVDGLCVFKIKQDKKDEDLYFIELRDFKKNVRAPIERAYNLCSDLGKVARLSLFEYEKIENFKVEVFSPIRPALAERLPEAQQIIEKIGECAVDAKYDGFRLQVHKDGEKIELYSRKLEKVTHAFPEIVEAAKKIRAKRCIFEGEALAYNAKEKRYYSFQITIQRKRKYGIEQMQKDFPLHMYAFDVMYIDGIDYTRTSFEKRREELEKLVGSNKVIVPSELKIVSKPRELEAYFEKCLGFGLEGIIAKDLSSPYVAGAREFAWIKLKKSYGEMADTLDTVVVGYYLGEGQRAEFNFGGLLVAVRDEQSGRLQTVAKIGSGFSEEEMATLGEELAEMKIKERPKELESKLKPDFWVEPKLVVSVSADEISVSSVHTCAHAGGKGYALRFPRLVDMREDKSVEDITTSSEVEKMYKMQKGTGRK
ncbi:MAG: ATP-dependent DNA ligase [Candidatus Micrarchaeota archaeon]